MFEQVLSLGLVWDWSMLSSIFFDFIIFYFIFQNFKILAESRYFSEILQIQIFSEYSDLLDSWQDIWWDEGLNYLRKYCFEYFFLKTVMSLFSFNQMKL